MAQYIDEGDQERKTKKVLTVDIHTHILPPPGLLPNLKEKFGYGGFISLHMNEQTCKCNMMIDDKFFRAVEDNCYDHEARVKDCDDDAVDVQVLSTVPVMFCYWAKGEDCLFVAQKINNHIADCVKKYPKRFIGLGTVPMQDPELAIQELRRCVTELGMAGVEIGTHINDWNLDAPELFPFFQEAEKLGAAIFIHPWDMMSKEKMPNYWLPWLVGMPAETSLAICSLIFGGVFDRLPKLRVAFAHGGGAFPGTIGRIEHGYNVRPDLCNTNNVSNPRSYVGKFWVDSIIHDDMGLQNLVRIMGKDNVVLGSDYPFPLGECYAPTNIYPGRLIRQVYDEDEEQKKKCLGLNALKWLDRDPADYE